MPTWMTELLEKYWSHTALLGIALWFWKSRDSLRGENADKKAEISSLKERNSELKTEIDRFREQNASLQNTINEKQPDRAIRAKYQFNEVGVAIHSETKKAYCPACLQNLPLKEVILTDSGSSDDYLRCPLVHDHTFAKRQDHGGGSHRSYAVEW